MHKRGKQLCQEVRTMVLKKSHKEELPLLTQATSEKGSEYDK